MEDPLEKGRKSHGKQGRISLQPFRRWFGSDLAFSLAAGLNLPANHVSADEANESHTGRTHKFRRQYAMYDARLSRPPPSRPPSFSSSCEML